MKVALYIRVSTERQAKEGDSLEDQENDLRKFCDYRKYHIYKCYIERGKSGGNTNRPEYQKLINDIEGRKIKAVIVKKLDRLSRSLLDFENLMKLMQEKEVEFISLKENFDTTNAMGKAMLRVALVFAQLEREQTSERILDVMTFRASKGLYNGGQTAFGYTNVNKELCPYSNERKIVEIMFVKFIENKSALATARFLNNTGYRDRNQKFFDNRRVEKMLKNPAYIGKVRWKGVVYQGIHRPIITEKIFNEVQQIFSNHRFVYRSNKTQALLQKIIFCGYCGSPMTTTYCLNRQKKKYYYYRCVGNSPSISNQNNKCISKHMSMKKLEAILLEILLSLSTEKIFNMLENKIKKYNKKIESAVEKVQTEILTLENTLDYTKSKLDKYLDSLISSQFLSEEREIINRKIQELELEEKQIQSSIAQQLFEQNHIKEEKIDTHKLKQDFLLFRLEHETYSFNKKRDFVVNTIKDVTCYADKMSIKYRFLPWEEDYSLWNT